MSVDVPIKHDLYLRRDGGRCIGHRDSHGMEVDAGHVLIGDPVLGGPETGCRLQLRTDLYRRALLGAVELQPEALLLDDAQTQK